MRTVGEEKKREGKESNERCKNLEREFMESKDRRKKEWEQNKGRGW